MSRRRHSRTHKRLVMPGLLGVIALVLVCVIGTIGYKRLVNNPENIDTAEIAAYEYEEVDSDVYGVAGGGTINGGEATRYKVTVIETPGEGGIVTDSVYVTSGKDVTLNVIQINAGFVFAGWYMNGVRQSENDSFTLKNVTADTTVEARFSNKSIVITTKCARLVDGEITSPNATIAPLGDGNVTPGGVYHIGEGVAIFATEIEGYSFVGFRVYKTDGPCDYGVKDDKIILYADDNWSPIEGKVDQDTTVYAVYERTNRTITLAMMPGAGKVQISSDPVTPSYSTHTINYTTNPGADAQLRFLAKLPDEQIQVYDEGSQKYKYVYRYSFEGLYYTASNGGSGHIWSNSGDYPRDVDQTYPVSIAASDGDVLFFYKLNTADAHDAANYGAVGVPYPAEAGVVSGGGSSTVSSSYQLTATPTAGYQFQRWEWTENGNSYTSTDNPLVVKPNGFVSYKACFLPKSYNVTLASIAPMGTASVQGLGGYSPDVDGKANATIYIKPINKNYELESVSYVYNGYTKDLAVPVISSDGIYSVVIQGFGGDIALNIKMKQVGGYRITATPDTDKPAVNTVSINGSGSTSENEASVSYVIGSDSPDAIKLTATPGTGYHVKQWVGSNGDVRPNSIANSSDPFEISIGKDTIKADVTYTAQFEELKNSITVKVDDTENATVKILDGNNQEISLDSNGNAKIDSGTDVKLLATANSGYIVKYWTNSAGIRMSGEPVTGSNSNAVILKNVTWSDTYTAHIVKADIDIELVASPIGAGSVQLNDYAPIDATHTYSDLHNGDTITLKANPGNGYKFVRWEARPVNGSTVTAYAEPDIQITNVTEDLVCTAIFSEITYTIKVVSSPIAGGIAATSGKIDEATYAPGEQATLEATPAAGYKFDYWTDSAGKKYTENPYVIAAVQGNDTFTAHFTQGKLAITLESTPQGAGVVKFNGRVVNSGSVNEIDSGSDVTLTAEVVDESKYVFERWESSKGTVATTNPLQLVNVTASETYTAVFNLKTGKTGIIVLASPASGGQATKTIASDGKSAELKAVPRSGYSFVEWRKNGVVVSKSKTFTTYDMADGTTYTAIFSKSGSADVKSDITKEHFYHEDRRVTAPQYTVTREGMENQAKAQTLLDKLTQYKDSTPPLKDYKAVNDAENIFDDIEIVEDHSVVMLDSELITTDGEIMPLTPVSDYSKEEAAANDFTRKKYGELYSCEIIACKDVGIPEGFVDGVRTYIWKYQDIHSKDNIYVLYDVAGRQDWVSCAVDAGDSIKFTIDSIGNGARMTIVKVIIE